MEIRAILIVALIFLLMIVGLTSIRETFNIKNSDQICQEFGYEIGVFDNFGEHGKIKWDGMPLTCYGERGKIIIWNIDKFVSEHKGEQK